MGSYSITTNNSEWRYTSVRNAGNTQGTFPWLRNLNEDYTYQYAIHVTKVEGNSYPNTWSQNVEIRVTLPAGVDANLRNAGSGASTEDNWNNLVSSGSISPVGDPEDFSVSRQFTDQTPPTFTGSYPLFRPSDSFVDMELQLSRRGTIYYVLAPAASDTISSPTVPATTKDGYVKLEDVPTSGAETNKCPDLLTPTQQEIYQGKYINADIKKGRVSVDTGVVSERVENLMPDTTYYAFFVIQGDSQNLSDVYMYKFTTTKVEVPEIGLSVNGNEVTVNTHVTSSVEWIVIPTTYNKGNYSILGKEFEQYFDDTNGTHKTWAEAKAALNITDSSFTVLDALLTRVGTSNQTVFDLLANETAYNTLYDYVVDKTAGSTTDQGNIPELVANVGQKVTCKLDEIGQYYFIAAARHVQGQEYAFHAVAGVQMSDTTPPTYTNLAGVQVFPMASNIGWGSYIIDMGKWQKDPANYEYQGKLTLSFDAPIYMYNSSNGKITKLTNANLKNYIGAGSVTITDASVNTAGGGGTIEIEYKGAVHGANITIFNSGYICDVDGNNMGGKITLTLNAFAPSPTGIDGTYYPAWTSSPQPTY